MNVLLDTNVLGRMAEEYGFNDIAATLFRKVPAPKLADEHTTYHLAQRRLKKKGQTPAPRQNKA